jgi:hypothetical protein
LVLLSTAACSFGWFNARPPFQGATHRPSL